MEAGTAAATPVLPLGATRNPRRTHHSSKPVLEGGRQALAADAAEAMPTSQRAHELAHPPTVDGRGANPWRLLPSPPPKVLVLGERPAAATATGARQAALAGSTMALARARASAAPFDHYADGGGLWDEAGVGVDVDALGPTAMWEA
eukprot:SM001497S01077  [mRNA]  locus=s1497:694:1753:- [translate_table: standard]